MTSSSPDIAVMEVDANTVISPTIPINTPPLDEPLEPVEPDVKQVLQMPPMEFFNKSFEAIWYQAEVLHKREIEKLEADQKSNDTKLAEMDESLKAGIFKFTKNILDMLEEYEIRNELKLTKLLDLYQDLAQSLFNDPNLDNEQVHELPPADSDE